MARPKAKDNGNRHYQGSVFSTTFLDNMLSNPEKVFVPLSDYKKLERKYFKMFHRYNTLKGHTGKFRNAVKVLVNMAKT